MNHYSFEDLSVGQIEKFQTTVTASMMDAFLQITGDTNPLHTDAAYAKAKGFNSQVVYGMLTASFYSTLIGVHLPGEKALFNSINLTFNKPVYVGDEIIIEGEVVYLNEAFKQVEIAAKITSLAGEVLSKAKLKAGILE